MILETVYKEFPDIDYLEPHLDGLTIEKKEFVYDVLGIGTKKLSIEDLCNKYEFDEDDVKAYDLEIAQDIRNSLKTYLHKRKRERLVFPEWVKNGFRHALLNDVPNAEFINMDELLLIAYDAMTEREQEMLIIRFGLVDDMEPSTLDEMAIEFNVSRERIRQIEAKYARMVSRAGHGFEVKRSRKIKDYLD